LVGATRSNKNYNKNGNTFTKFKKFQQQIVHDIIPNILLNVSIYPLSIRESSTKGIRNIFTVSSLVVDQSSKALTNSTYRNNLLGDIWHLVFPESTDTSKSFTYDVLFVDNKYEIRNYSNYTAVNIKEVGDIYPDILLSSIEKFNVLALYLAGKNKEQVKISMTSPVIMTFQNDFVNNASMSFILPKDTSPAPISDEITITEVPAATRVIKRFNGLVTNRELIRQKKKLVTYIEKLNFSYDKNEFELFEYDSPFVLPWERRNEVSVLLTNFTDEFNVNVVLKALEL